MNWQERTELLIEKKGLEKLKGTNILVVGLGGVGSFACEILARSGVGKITVVDPDKVDITNINRQLIALHSTIGQNKTDLVQKRLLDINPLIEVRKETSFLNPEDIEKIISSEEYNCVLDCIDTIKPKIELLVLAKKKKIKIISSMGAGGVINNTKIKSADISKSRDCMLAKKIRKELKYRGVSKGIRVIYSEEIPNPKSLKIIDEKYKKSYYGTISYMPSLFGLFVGAEAIRYILSDNIEEADSI